MGGLASKIVDGALGDRAALLIVEHGMEQNIALDIVGVLRPAVVLLEVVPSRAGAGGRLEGSLGRGCCILAGGALHGAHQLGIFIVVVQTVDIYPLVGSGHLHHIGFHSLLRLTGEEQLHGGLISDAALCQSVALLEGAHRGFGGCAILTVQSAEEILQTVEPALQTHDVIAVVAGLHIGGNCRERRGIEGVQQHGIRHAVHFHGQLCAQIRIRRNRVIMGAQLGFLQLAHILLQVLNCSLGPHAVITVGAHIGKAQFAQPSLQLFDLIAGRAHGKHGVIRRLRSGGIQQILGFQIGHAGLGQAVVVLENAHTAGSVAAVVAVGHGGGATQAQQALLKPQHIAALVLMGQLAAGGNEGVGIDIGLQQRVRHAVHLGDGQKSHFILRHSHGRGGGFGSRFRGGLRGFFGNQRQLMCVHRQLHRSGRVRGLDGRRLRGHGGLRGAGVDQILLQFAHIVFQRFDGALGLLAEIAVGHAVQKAQFDQPLLKALGKFAVLIQGKLGIEGRGHADGLNLQRLRGVHGQFALGVGLRLPASLNNGLVNGLGQRF